MDATPDTGKLQLKKVIKKKIADKGLDQQQFADMIGMKRSTFVAQLRNNKFAPSVVAKIADILFSVDVLTLEATYKFTYGPRMVRLDARDNAAATKPPDGLSHFRLRAPKGKEELVEQCLEEIAAAFEHKFTLYLLGVLKGSLYLTFAAHKLDFHEIVQLFCQMEISTEVVDELSCERSEGMLEAAARGIEELQWSKFRAKECMRYVQHNVPIREQGVKLQMMRKHFRESIKKSIGEIPDGGQDQFETRVGDGKANIVLRISNVNGTISMAFGEHDPTKDTEKPLASESRPLPAVESPLPYRD